MILALNIGNSNITFGGYTPDGKLSHSHPLTFHIVGSGLDPSACPFPSLRRGGIYAARNLPTVCRQSSPAR